MPIEEMGESAALIQPFEYRLGDIGENIEFVPFKKI